MRLRTQILIATPLIAIIIAPIAFFAIWFCAAAGSDKGSPELAAKWHDELAAISNEVDASKLDSTIEVLEFQNGEWLFGRAQNSHGIWHTGGGTLVIKDSNGDTRAFFGGHVCGTRFLWNHRHHQSLDAFYKQLSEEKFEEYDSSQLDIISQ